MRVSLLGLLAVVAVALPLRAQGRPCEDFPPPPSPPQDGAPRQDFISQIFLAAPQNTGVLLPRNVEMRLGGPVSELGLGFFTLSVSADGVPVDVVVEGVRVVPVDDGLLPANANIEVTITPTETHPCPGCFGPLQHLFATNDDVDTTPPALSSVDVRGYILPSQADQQECGFFFGNTHSIEFVFDSDEELEVSLGGRAARTEPVVMLRRGVLPRGVTTLSFSLGATTPLSIGEAVVVVIAARDLAGNVAEPRVVRLRMRSFGDRGQNALPSLSCELPPTPALTRPSTWSTTPAFRVLPPFEEVPLALRPAAGGADIALIPGAAVVEDARVGHIYTTAAAVDAGDYDVVGLPCPQCICPDCNTPFVERITISGAVDVDAPAAPVVVDVVDDPSPALSEGACVADDASTVIVLEAGVDDVSGAADLVYDAVIAVDGDLPRPAGASVVATARDDGNIEVRLPTASIGRVAGANFALTLTARDAAGRTSQTRYDNVVDVEDSGCGGCGGDGSAAFVGVCAVTLLRRSRRHAR
jgi:hypothetical protein